MSKKWTKVEVDGFISEICTASVAAAGLSQTFQRYDIPEWDDSPGGNVKRRIGRILDHYVDFDSDEWDHFDGRTGLMQTVRPESITRNLLSDIRREILVLARVLHPSEWGGVSDRPTAAPLSRDEQREAHAATIRNTVLVRERFERILSPLETEPNAVDLARLEVRRATDLAEREAAVQALREHMEKVRDRPAPAPVAQPYGVSHRGAEFLVADWMRHLGLVSAVVTSERSDGGVDVESDSYLTQVKNYKGNVSVIEIRELYGVAAAQGKKALFFTSGGYTVEAKALAALIEMPLFKYVAEEGVLQGVGVLGQTIVDDGLAETRVGESGSNQD